MEGQCDAVDLNLDWNQAKAERGPYGAALQTDWPRVVAMVSAAVAAGVSVPITCKMRLFATVEETVARALELEQAGCSMLVVHGRTRSAKGERTGMADWTAIAAVKAALSIPVVANGGVAQRTDVAPCLAHTHADGVMLGRALLYNPRCLEEPHPSVVDVTRE